MVTPDRIAEVHLAGIGGRAHHTANKTAGECAHGRIARHGPYRRAAGPANQGSAYATLSGISTATTKKQHNCETCKRKSNAHDIVPDFVTDFKNPPTQSTPTDWRRLLSTMSKRAGCLNWAFGPIVALIGLSSNRTG
jgi:hypothetical protein